MKKQKHPSAIIHDEAVKLVRKYAKLETIKCKCASNYPQSWQRIYDVSRLIRKRQILRNLFSKPKEGLNDQIYNHISKRLDRIANFLPKEGYSMGSIIELKLITASRKCMLSAVSDTSITYSKSCGYRARHGGYSVSISTEEFQHLTVINGLVTYLYPIAGNLQLCWWFQGEGKRQHFKLHRKEGCIEGGRHIEKDITKAQRKAKLIKLSNQSEYNCPNLMVGA